MVAEWTIGLPFPYAETVWQWFTGLPERIKKQMGRTDDSFESFVAGFENDVVYLVFDGDLLGCVILENKSVGTYEIHLFCPRNTSSTKLGEAIHTFFDKVKGDDRVSKIIFNIRARQFRLGQCVINEGASDTGWRYREKGETFVTLVWQK